MQNIQFIKFSNIQKGFHCTSLSSLLLVSRAEPRLQSSQDSTYFEGSKRVSDGLFNFRKSSEKIVFDNRDAPPLVYQIHLGKPFFTFTRRDWIVLMAVAMEAIFQDIVFNHNINNIFTKCFMSIPFVQLKVNCKHLNILPSKRIVFNIFGPSVGVNYKG